MGYISNNRAFILASSIIVMLIMGFCYMYSIIQPYVMKYFSTDSATASLPFSIFLAVFVVGNLVGGRLQQKLNVKVVLLIGSIFMITGVFATAFLPTDRPWLMWITYGVLLGLGDGIIYNVVLSVVQKWFPDKKGFATGALLAALGLGGTILSPLCNTWLINYGFSTTFVILAGVFLAIALWGIATLKTPPDGYMSEFVPKGVAKTDVKQYTPKEMVRTKEYYMLTVSFMLAIPAYVLISAIFVSMGKDRGLTNEMAVTGVMLASLSQVAGRFLISSISDTVGRKNAIASSFLLTTAAIFTLTVAHGYMYVACFAVLSLTYGSFAATYPSITSDYFGVKNIGINYSVVMIGFGLAAVLTPLLSKALKGMDAGTSLSFTIAGCAAVIGMILIFMLGPVGKGKKQSAAV